VIPYKKNLKELSKSLRSNLTEAERCLWKRIRLKHLGYVFYRQKPIGDYIVDFYCPKAKLVIEVDGGQHFSGETRDNDKIRNEYLQSIGLMVLRFPNTEVQRNIEGVVERIIESLQDKIPLNPPCLRRSGYAQAGFTKGGQTYWLRMMFLKENGFVSLL
jgi:very-short-patch-repair endonuclease